MKYFLLMIACAMLAGGCQKGRNMSAPTAIAFDFTETELNIQDDFSPFSAPDSERVVKGFQEELLYFLERNNLYLDNANPQFILKVNSISMVTSETYTTIVDSCAGFFNDYQSEIALTDYYYGASVTLMAPDGTSLNTFSRSMSREERVKDKGQTDEGCPDYKVKSPICGMECMERKVAKRLRAAITRDLVHRID